MNIHPAKDADLAPVFALFSRDAENLRENVGATQTADTYVDRRPQNFEASGWLPYEGTSARFPLGLHEEVIP